jgi:hypothetical protein
VMLWARMASASVAFWACVSQFTKLQPDFDVAFMYWRTSFALDPFATWLAINSHQCTTSACFGGVDPSDTSISWLRSGLRCFDIVKGFLTDAARAAPIAYGFGRMSPAFQ